MAFRFKEQEKTLHAVQSGLRTAKQIYEADDDRAHISIMAINHRLLRLFEAGYVTRKRGPGKYFYYTATAKARLA